MSVTAPVLGLLGAGNIASAMVAGWCTADAGMAERIVVTDRGSGRAAALADRHGLRHVADNADVVAAADIVVLCVKPIDVEKVLREVSDLVTPKKAIASVAAGVGTATLETILDVDAPVFRFMPNVGVRVGAGTLAFSAGRFNDTAAEQAVLAAFSLLGEVVPLEERLFDRALGIRPRVPRPDHRGVRGRRDRLRPDACRRPPPVPVDRRRNGGAAARGRPRLLRPEANGHEPRRDGGGGAGLHGAGRCPRCHHRRRIGGGAPGRRARLTPTMGITTAEQFVFSLYVVYSLLIILYVLMSWVRLPYNIWIGRLRGFLHDTVEPLLRPIRSVLPSMGGLDLSPLVALLGVSVLERIVIAVLDGFR
jgi:uncharacterized protein YggT (Ycf19 family)